MKFQYSDELEAALRLHLSFRRPILNIIRDACETVENGGTPYDCPFVTGTKNWRRWRNVYLRYYDEYNSCRNYY